MNMRFFTIFLIIVLTSISLPSLAIEQIPILQLSTGGPTDSTRALLLNKDETLLVAAGDDKVIRVWNTHNSQQVMEIRGELAGDIKGSITSMAVSPDDKWLAVGVFYPHLRRGMEIRGYLRIHDFQSGRLVRVLSGYTKVLTTLQFSQDGSLLLGAEGLNDDPLIILWDTNTWEVKKQIRGHTGTISRVIFSPDNRLILSSSWDKSIRIWDLSSGKNIRTVDRAHTGRIFGLAIPSKASNPIAISSSEDKSVKIWNYRTGELIRSIKFDRQVRSVIANLSGTRLLVASVGEHINSWISVVDIKTGKVISRYREHDRSPRAIVLSKNEDTVYSSGGFLNEIDKWSLSNGQQLFRISGTGKPIQAVGISKNGNTVFWGQQPINWSGRQYDFDQLAVLSHQFQLNTIHGQLDQPRLKSNKFKAPSRRLRKHGKLSLQRVKSKKNSNFSILNIKRGRKVIGRIERQQTTGHSHTAYTFSPDGKFVVSGAENGYLSIHRLDGTKIGDLSGHVGYITDLAVSGDGKLLVSGSSDQTFKLWNLDTRELLLSFFVNIHGEWIVWTTTGHYMSSPNGDHLIGWVFNRDIDRNADYVRARQMKRLFYRPDIIRKIMETRDLDLALKQSKHSTLSVSKVQKEKVIPLNFGLISPMDRYTTDASSVNLQLKVTESPDANIEWSIYVNDRLVLKQNKVNGKRNSESDGSIVNFPIDLDPGKNIVKVLADNNETEKTVNFTYVRNTKSVPVPVSTRGNSKLLVISIGVDEYINLYGNNLDYASADADSVADLFSMQEGKTYDQVETIVLSDSREKKATRSNIVEALKSLETLRSEDTVIVFLAGHGVLDNSDYYFLPREATLLKDGRWEKSTVLRWGEIQHAIESTLGRRILLVDTCHSESAFNSRLAKDAENSNIIVMSSTDSATLAQEITSLGHGVFTHAILSGVKGGADSYKDNIITMSELNAFVSNEVSSITKKAQIPTLSVPGGFKDFELATLL